MFLNIINFLRKNLFMLVLFLIFAGYLNFFFNIHSIISRSYEERVGRSYGYGCEKNSYGFIKHIKDNFLNSSEVHIINYSNIYPDFKSFFHELKKDQFKKNLIILNIDENNLRNLNLDFTNYQIIYTDNKCFYLKKND